MTTTDERTPTHDPIAVNLQRPNHHARTLYEYREAALHSIDFSRYSRLVRSLLQTDIGLITFHDGTDQFALSETNRLGRQRIPKIIPKLDSVCQYTVQLDDESFVVDDMTMDDRFNHLAYVDREFGIRSYAGHPIQTEEGFNIGAVCAINDRSRQWSDSETLVLRDIAQMISNDMSLFFKTQDVNMQQKMQGSIVSFIRSNWAECADTARVQKVEGVVVSPESEQNSVYDNATRILKSTLDLQGVLFIDIGRLLQEQNCSVSSATKMAGSILAYRHDACETTLNLAVLTRDLCSRILTEGGCICSSAALDILHELIGYKVRSACVVPLYDANNGPYGLTVVFRTSGNKSFTTTDWEYLEAFGSTLTLELQRAKLREADDLKAQFIRSLSHELRTPLHGLLHNLDNLSETKLDAEQRDLLGEITSCSNIQLSMVETVLELSEVQANAKELAIVDSKIGEAMVFDAVDVLAMVEEAVDAAISRHQLITNKLATNDTMVLVDYSGGQALGSRQTNSSMLKNIIQQLVSNSLKWTSKGTIKIAIDIPDDLENDDVYISISDTGIGISPHFMQNHLYSSFSKEDSFTVGLGIGLAVVANTIRHLGGSIDMDSVKGSYTAVHLTLPMKRSDSRTIGARTYTTNHIVALLESEDQDQSQRTVMKILERDLRQNHGCECRIVNTQQDLSGVDILFATTLEQLRQFETSIPRVVFSKTRPVEAANFSSEELRITYFYSPYLLSQILSQYPASDVKPSDTDLDGSQASFSKFRKRELSDSSRRAASTTHDTKTNVRRISGSWSLLSECSRESYSKGGYFDMPSSTDAPISAYQTPPTSAGSALAEELKTTTILQTMPPSPLQSPTAKPKVLIVEDNPTNSRLLSRFMQKNGFEYQAVENGLEAVQAVESMHAPGAESFDVILMDIQMPVMDGLTATKRIRDMEKKEHCQAYIVACTGLSAESERTKAREVGCNDFITKPISLNTLRGLFAKWSHGRIPSFAPAGL